MRVPDFLLLGAQRAATASLSAALRQHPAIAMIEPAALQCFASGEEWEVTPHPAPGHGPDALLVGAAASSALADPLVPMRAAASTPRARLVAVLRDPADRASSHYHDARRRGVEPLELEEALHRETASLAIDEGARGRALTGGGYLAGGWYDLHLAAWLEHFPAEQLLVMTLEQLVTNGRTALARVCHFLGLAVPRAISLPHLNPSEHPPLIPALRQRLDAHFAPHHAGLEARLGVAVRWHDGLPARPLQRGPGIQHFHRRAPLPAAGSHMPLFVTALSNGDAADAGAFLKSVGLDLGVNHLDADEGDPHGRSGDSAFLAFQQTLAWCDRRRTQSVDAQAVAADLLAWRRPQGWWGFSDARTLERLDLWRELLPDLRVLILYRPPWDTGDPTHPDSGDRAHDWCAGARAALEAAAAHPAGVVLAGANRLAEDPVGLVRCLQLKLGFVPAVATAAEVRLAAARRLDPRRFRSISLPPAPGIPLPCEARALFEALERRADLPVSPPGDRLAVILRDLVVPPPATDPAVSVIITCHDDGHFLPDAYASLARLPLDGVEVILVDDGSTDTLTRALVDTVAVRGGQVIRQPHAGLSAARNRGIQCARGRYVIPLDADNLLRAPYLTEGVAALDAAPTVGVLYGNAQRFGEVRAGWVVGPFDAARLLPDNYIDACALIRKSALASIGGYDEQMPPGGWEDWEVWLALIEAGWEFHYLPEICFDYRTRSDSMVHGLEEPRLRRRLQAYIWAKHGPLYARRPQPRQATAREPLHGAPG